MGLGRRKEARPQPLCVLHVRPRNLFSLTLSLYVSLSLSPSLHPQIQGDLEVGAELALDRVCREARHQPRRHLPSIRVVTTLVEPIWHK